MSDKKELEVLRPSSIEEVCNSIKEAAQKKEILAIAGNNTRCGFGNPVIEANKRLEMGGINDLVFYEPKDLVIRVHAGMALGKIRELLSKEGQYLPFEPPSLGKIYNNDPAKTTIGGAVATALSGPRRISAGGVRDYVLGIQAINGQGDLYKAGGRTMKNVTGYDVSKFLTGSFGTLSVLTEVTLKVLPAPRDQQTICLKASQLAEDLELFVRLSSRPLGVSGLARIEGKNGETSLFIRLEGSPTGVKLHGEEVQDLLSKREDVRAIQRDESMSLWESVRELAPLDVQKDDLVFKSCLSIHKVDQFIKAAKEQGCFKKYFIDWGGNVIYSTMRSTQPEIDVAHLRNLAGKFGVQSLILRAPRKIRLRYGAFPALDESVKKLALRTKSALDPLHILNTGRMIVQK